MQKHAVSNVLRRAASRPRGSALRRCRLLHMGVRLGMFTESPRQLRSLHRAAEQAVEGIEAHYAAEPPPGGGSQPTRRRRTTRSRASTRTARTRARARTRTRTRTCRRLSSINIQFRTCKRRF